MIWIVIYLIGIAVMHSVFVKADKSIKRTAPLSEEEANGRTFLCVLWPLSAPFLFISWLKCKLEDMDN